MGKIGIVSYWNDRYSTGGLIYGEHPSGAALQLERYLSASFSDEEPLKILEIGGGYGRNSIYLDEMGRKNGLKEEITIVDISNVALTLGKKLNSLKHGSVNFVQGDVKHLNSVVKPGAYDVVFHNFCLHLFDPSERKLIYSQVREILKNGGIFAGSYLSINDPDHLSFESSIDTTKIVRGIPQHFFTKSEIQDELSPYFRIESEEERKDPEKIISEFRDTVYFYVIARKTKVKTETEDK